MRPPVDDTPDLELALLRRGVDERDAGREQCAHCRRTPLTGEHVYLYAPGTVRCALCRMLAPEAPVEAQLVHGPEFGHTIRITDRRA